MDAARFDVPAIAENLKKIRDFVRGYIDKCEGLESYRDEIVLAIVGGLFVLETISVIIQVLSFKLTGKRVFMMAPLHHHFELLGWHENHVVVRFWIIGILLALISLTTFKIQ